MRLLIVFNLACLFYISRLFLLTFSFLILFQPLLLYLVLDITLREYCKAASIRTCLCFPSLSCHPAIWVHIINSQYAIVFYLNCQLTFKSFNTRKSLFDLLLQLSFPGLFVPFCRF